MTCERRLRKRECLALRRSSVKNDVRTPLAEPRTSGAQTFALAAVPREAPAIAIGGNTWEVLGRIWYATLTQRLTSDADFNDFARATVGIAGELYGNGGSIQSAAPLRSRRRLTPRCTTHWRVRPVKVALRRMPE
jgi:hypothetical protein